MFHHFHGGTHPQGQGSIDANTFADMIEFVGRHRLLDASEWQARAEAGRLVPGDLCLTFDDGLACQYEVALPVLEAYDLRAFWFVYTSPLDGVVQRLELYRHYRDVAFADIAAFYQAFEACLADSDYAALAQQALVEFSPTHYLAEFPFYSNDDRRFRFLRDQVLGPTRYFALMDAMVAAAGYDPLALSRRLFITAEGIAALHRTGHTIGLHSHTHPTRLAALDAATQGHEYRTNRARIEAVTRVPVQAMSHPCNSYNADTLNLLARMGIQVGFRSNMAAVEGKGRFEYPREDHANLLREMRP